MPATGDIRVVADGFDRPTGLCFSPDEKTLYVTDTGAARRADAPMAATRPATVYAYSVATFDDGGGGGGGNAAPFLTGRRVFAYADAGVPEGVRCDVFGNVYCGCGDGVNVWDRGGSLIGKILVEGGVAGFCWGRGGEMWVFGEERLWRVQMAGGTKGALLGI